MTMTFQKITVIGNDQGSTFVLGQTSLKIKHKQEKKWEWLEFIVPLRHIVWAGLTDDIFEVSFLARKRNKRKGSLHLERYTGFVDEVSRDTVGRFMEDIQNSAYADVKPERRLKVIINPKAGPGKSVQLFKKQIEPLFQAAKCKIDVTYTAHHQHAIEIARTLPLDQFDAVVSIGGDGIIYEVLNGFAEHQDPMRALKIPVSPVPTGSGNGLSLNILGINEGLDILAAALNGAKGRPMPIDIVSVAQGPKRSLSFMTQATGLMAEADLRSEHLRAMGSTRFLVYFLMGVAKSRRVPIKVQIKVANADKEKMVEDLRISRTRAKHDLELTLSKSRSTARSSMTTDRPTTITDQSATTEDESGMTTSGPFFTATEVGETDGDAPPDVAQDVAPTAEPEPPANTEDFSAAPPSSPDYTPPATRPTIPSSLPPLKYASLKDEELREEDGWITITDPVLWCMAGKGPYVGETFMQFPVSVPNDGLIDVAVHKPTSRTGLIKAMDGAEKGKLYWTNDEMYYKATAYRVTPLTSNKRASCVSVDGEAFAFEPYHVEVHPSLGTLLSPYGFYCAEFDWPSPKKTGSKK